MTITIRTVPTRWRLLVPAALLAAAATLGGSAFGDPAVAFAEPQEWDIGNYDACMAHVLDLWLRGEISSAGREELSRGCCTRWGGVLQEGAHGAFKCVAPPANAAGRRVPQGVITHTLTPTTATAPPGDITQTLTPAS